MRVFFIGTVEFSKKSLQKLIELDVRVIGLCTKKKSSFHSDFSDLTYICKEKKIPFKFVKDIHGIDVNDISPDFRRLLGLGSDSKNRGAVH